MDNTIVWEGYTENDEWCGEGLNMPAQAVMSSGRLSVLKALIYKDEYDGWIDYGPNDRGQMILIFNLENGKWVYEIHPTNSELFYTAKLVEGEPLYGG